MLPSNLNDAINTSKKYNPELIIAKLEYEQSEKDVLISDLIYHLLQIFLMKILDLKI